MGREQIALSNDWFRNNPTFPEAGQGDANISAIIGKARYAALDTFLLDFEREPQHYVAGRCRTCRSPTPASTSSSVHI